MIFVTGHGESRWRSGDAARRLRLPAETVPATRFLITRVQKALELDSQNAANWKEASLIREHFRVADPRERRSSQLVTDGKANKGHGRRPRRQPAPSRSTAARVMEDGREVLAQLVRMSLDLAKSTAPREPRGSAREVAPHFIRDRWSPDPRGVHRVGPLRIGRCSIIHVGSTAIGRIKGNWRG